MTCTCRGNHNRSQTGRFSVSLYVEGASRQHWHGNAVGTPGIFSLGNYALKAGEKTTLYNPFHSFPRSMEIASLRYMFTWINKDTRQQYYYGNIVITPESYHQTVRLEMPVKGTSILLSSSLLMNVVMLNGTFWLSSEIMRKLAGSHEKSSKVPIEGVRRPGSSVVVESNLGVMLGSLNDWQPPAH